MNIQSAQYHDDLVSGVRTGVICSVDGEVIFVPLDPNNRHYAEILRQVEAGELTIQEAS